eukprot:CAMPEP_0172941718 /NCGR_PEP_ID=MMETSP1075-20121228/224680_1 /TAXON_ID=2916 /ORGANISM="Ceratium fusus, Strain PA161109" /LENGTH=39 /DNA_ID= /DNA_START= /DNA_END= /DNA_ORIENTATION=
MHKVDICQLREVQIRVTEDSPALSWEQQLPHQRQHALLL